MTTPDLVNGLFEGVSSGMVWLNVRAILRDKQVRGFSLVPMSFFTAWGYWNLYYYPQLHQYLSFAGGLSMVLANSIYLGACFKYADN